MFRNIMIFLMFLICTFIGYFIGENYKRRKSKFKRNTKSIVVIK